jgi:hypothetical protein
MQKVTGTKRRRNGTYRRAGCGRGWKTGRDVVVLNMCTTMLRCGYTGPLTARGRRYKSGAVNP